MKLTAMKKNYNNQFIIRQNKQTKTKQKKTFDLRSVLLSLTRTSCVHQTRVDSIECIFKNETLIMNLNAVRKYTDKEFEYDQNK